MYKTLLTLVLFVLITAGCNLKVNLNTNGSTIQIEPGNSNQNQNQNTNESVASVNAIENTNSDQQTIIAQADYSFDVNGEGMIKQIVNKTSGEVVISEIKALCGNEMMIYARPENTSKVILAAFNPGSDKPVSNLYLLDLSSKTCKKLEVSKELSDFGARVLSPDQSKLAVALETNEAKELKVLDLIADQSKTLVTLGPDETLNSGYGALSNKFDIKWVGNDQIQYTVYEDTVKNYPDKTPENTEKVKEVRIININK
jgi:hypothetical protein